MSCRFRNLTESFDACLAEAHMYLRIMKILRLLFLLSMALSCSIAETQPPFPKIGSEYRFTILDDKSPKPFASDEGQVLIMAWLRGTWYRVAYQEIPGDGRPLIITNLNISQLLTLSDVPEGAALIKPVLNQNRESSSNTIIVRGQVNKPGEVSIPEGAEGMTLGDVIAATGDLRGIANKRAINIVRKSREGEATALTLDFRTSQDVMLEPGDLVIVPQRTFD